VKDVDEDKCAQCGTPAAPGAKFCESCGAPLAAVSQPAQATAPAQPAPYTAPVAQASYAPPGAQGQYQGVAIRFVAILVDAIILGIISYILIAIFAVSAITIDPSTGAVSIGSAYWLVIVLDLIIYFLYYTLLEGHGGQTVGKMAVKIRVVREADGSRIDYGQAAIRTILRIIDGIFVYLIGAIFIWSSDKKQRLGDRVAHTVVVKA
jgi:uncharacterized RDD family membrane protein YckC